MIGIFCYNKKKKLWDIVKAVLRWDFIALNEHIRKEEMSEINNVRSHLNNLEKEKQNKPRVSGRK